MTLPGGAAKHHCAQEPALGPNHGLRPEMSPTQPRAIFATTTRHPGEGLCRSHHVSWAATPAQLNPPTRHLLPDKGAGAPAHSYAPAPHSRQSALEATQPHLTARRPWPHSRPLLLPHAHHGRSTARRPLAEMRHLRSNTRPSSCSPSHRAAAAMMEHIKQEGRNSQKGGRTEVPVGRRPAGQRCPGAGAPAWQRAPDLRKAPRGAPSQDAS